MIVGDVFIVPLRNGNYGLCQVLRRTGASKWSNTLTAIFDIQLTLDELKIFNFIQIHSLDVITLLPVKITHSKLSELLLVKVNTLVPIDFNLPLFVNTRVPQQDNKIALSDFGEAFYGYFNSEDVNGAVELKCYTKNTTIPFLISDYFEHGKEYTKEKWNLDWWRGSVRESYLRRNPNAFTPYLESPAWKRMPASIEALPDRTAYYWDLISRRK